MNTPEFIENKCILLSAKELAYFCMDNGFLKKEMFCQICNHALKLVPYKRSKDELAWRCMHKICSRYKLYTSIRSNSFFDQFDTSLGVIIRIIVKYSTRQPMYSIKNSMSVGERTIERVIKALIAKIPSPDFSSNKLGGPRKIVQIDETILNYKCKSHRGRSPSNKTDSLCIIEFENKITRVFATCIPNKKAETLIPIICRQVASNSIIWTDEHRSYNSLHSFSYYHDSVCHKYMFVNHENGVNTQAVESFHNEMKLQIKRKKGILTENREEFLKEFCFYLNNRSNFSEAIFNLIKMI
ncbi:hypothetical protein H311_01083 [Anncaliia algerae PRA109]|nr:hypothetical protein H311_01083 [Anncaliia algerae PRA109]